MEGKVAVVTGGGSGIGRAAALRFAREGARVVICGRTQEKLDDTVAQAEDAPGEVVAVQADIAEVDDVRRLYREVEDRWGRLDVLFAHAGVNGVWAPIEELEPEEWQQTVDVNLTGTFLSVKYAVPLLKRQGGAIVVTSSINGTRKFSDVGSTAYSTTKAGLLAFVQMLALELADQKIRVNAVCPGSIDTEVEEHTTMRDTEATEEVATYPHGGIPLTGGDPGTAEQVAEAVLFLASDRARHVTGTPLWIDGGQSLVQG